MWWVHPSAERDRSPCKAVVADAIEECAAVEYLELWAFICTSLFTCSMCFIAPKSGVWQMIQKEIFFHGYGRWIKYQNHVPLLSFAVLNISSWHVSEWKLLSYWEKVFPWNICKNTGFKVGSREDRWHLTSWLESLTLGSKKSQSFGVFSCSWAYKGCICPWPVTNQYWNSVELPDLTPVARSQCWELSVSLLVCVDSQPDEN